jgi:hypothetical protein
MRIIRGSFAAFAAAWVALGIACTNPVDVLESTTTTIGAEGGVAHSADGRLELEIARGALRDDAEIVIRTDRTIRLPHQTSLGYAITPERMLDVPAELRLARSGIEDEAIARIEGGVLIALAGEETELSLSAALASVEAASFCGVETMPIDSCGDGVCSASEDRSTPTATRRRSQSCREDSRYPTSTRWRSAASARRSAP